MTAEYIIDGKEYETKISDWEVSMLIIGYLQRKHEATEIQVKSIYLEVDAYKIDYTEEQPHDI